MGLEPTDGLGARRSRDSFDGARPDFYGLFRRGRRLGCVGAIPLCVDCGPQHKYLCINTLRHRCGDLSRSWRCRSATRSATDTGGRDGHSARLSRDPGPIRGPERALLWGWQCCCNSLQFRHIAAFVCSGLRSRSATCDEYRKFTRRGSGLGHHADNFACHPLHQQRDIWQAGKSLHQPAVQFASASDGHPGALFCEGPNDGQRDGLRRFRDQSA